MAALLALAAAAVFGAADFTGGRATDRTPVLPVTLTSNVVGVALGVALVAIAGGTFDRPTITWSALGGLCGLGGLVLLYQGLAAGPNRLVSPVSAVVAAVLPVGVGIASGERPGALAIVGLALAAPAIWLVAGGDLKPAPAGGGVAGDRATIAMAVGAGVGFGLFFTCLAQTPDDAGAAPLLVARLISTTTLVAAFVIWRSRTPKVEVDRHGLRLATLAGTLDMSANGLFLWSTLHGDLSIVGALVSLFPVTTILLAMALLGERMTRAQALGLTLAIATAAFLA
ncbi:MAG: EamA family transporter [Acidimicrobiales bacterium]